MSLLILATLCCMTANHTYYQYLNGKRPTSSPHFRDASDWILDQTIVSDVGIALAYVGQTFLAVAIATSCEQIFWRTIRSRGHAISHIDALMKVQVSPISSSFLCALRDPLGMAPALLALLAASMPLLSIFAPGSIKVSANYSQSEGCMVLAPRNLSAMVVETTLGDYAVPIGAVMSSGNYLPPVGGCGSDRSLDCSYELQFVGPGLDCDDVPAPNNLPEPAGTQDEYGILDPISLYEALFTQMDDLTMQLSVQTWDPQRSVYQAANCTGVLRSYSVSISHTTTSVIEDVTKSRTFSVVHANITQLSTFAGDLFIQYYLFTRSPIYLLGWHTRNPVRFCTQHNINVNAVGAGLDNRRYRDNPSRRKHHLERELVAHIGGVCSKRNAEPSFGTNLRLASEPGRTRCPREYHHNVYLHVHSIRVHAFSSIYDLRRRNCRHRPMRDLGISRYQAERRRGINGLLSNPSGHFEREDVLCEGSSG